MQPRSLITTTFLALTLAAVATTTLAGRAPSFVFPVAPLASSDVESQITDLTRKLRSSDEEERRDAVTQLAALNTRLAADALRSALDDASEQVRAQAITGLASIGDSSIAPAIAARLAQDKRPFVRKTAAYALGRLANLSTTPALVSALKDKDDEVRGVAAVALGQYKDPTAIAALSQSLADKNDFVRAHAAHALGVQGAAAVSTVPRLIGLLNSDKENRVRRQAARALGLIGDRSALPALDRAQRNPDPYLSLEALEAISKIKSGDTARL